MTPFTNLFGRESPQVCALSGHPICDVHDAGQIKAYGFRCLFIGGKAKHKLFGLNQIIEEICCAAVAPSAKGSVSVAGPHVAIGHAPIVKSHAGPDQAIIPGRIAPMVYEDVQQLAVTPYEKSCGFPSVAAQEPFGLVQCEKNGFASQLIGFLSDVPSATVRVLSALGDICGEGCVVTCQSFQAVLDPDAFLTAFLPKDGTRQQSQRYRKANHINTFNQFLIDLIRPLAWCQRRVVA